MRQKTQVKMLKLVLSMALLAKVNSDTLDNALELEIEDSQANFESGAGVVEEKVDLAALETEDWKEAPKFFKACTDFGIEKGDSVHR